MMGLITRQELHASLRQELDDVRSYIDATNALELGQHIANTNNPHRVTKAQVGLGSVDNIKQATKSEFDAHVNTRNPHGTNSADVGAVPLSRQVIAGTGLSGGGALGSNRTLSLDRDYTDNRYLRANAVSTQRSGSVRPLVFERTTTHPGTAEIHRGYGGVGFSIGGGNPEFHIAPDGSVGVGHYASSRRNKMIVSGSIETTNSIVVGTSISSSVGAIYRRSSDDQFRVRHNSGMEQIYTSKNIKYGTRAPSGGSSGDIYIQY